MQGGEPRGAHILLYVLIWRKNGCTDMSDPISSEISSGCQTLPAAAHTHFASQKHGCTPAPVPSLQPHTRLQHTLCRRPVRCEYFSTISRAPRIPCNARPAPGLPGAGTATVACAVQLDNCKLTERCGEHLEDVLLNTRTLQLLSLGWNHLGPRGAAALATGIESNLSLTTLRVRLTAPSLMLSSGMAAIKLDPRSVHGSRCDMTAVPLDPRDAHVSIGTAVLSLDYLSPVTLHSRLWRWAGDVGKRVALPPPPLSPPAISAHPTKELLPSVPMYAFMPGLWRQISCWEQGVCVGMVPLKQVGTAKRSTCADVPWAYMLNTVYVIHPQSRLCSQVPTVWHTASCPQGRRAHGMSWPELA